MRITVVPDQGCPECGNEGSPKVADNDGTWWWKCFTPYDQCKVGYWVPEDGRIERKPTPEAEAELIARVRAEVEESMRGRVWITRGNSSRMIPEGDPVPTGWHLGTE